MLLRSPIQWLDSVRSPLFVLEGSKMPSNIGSLRKMEAATSNGAIRFVPVDAHDHFSILAPANEVIAKKIVEDTGPTSRLTLSAAELNVP